MIESMFRYIQAIFLLAMCLFAHHASSNSDAVVTIAPLSDNDTRYIYANELLRRILQKTATSTDLSTIELYHEAVSRERTLSLLKEGKIDVIAEATQKYWEQALIPIRIPIRKGIQGYRLFLVHKDHAKTLAESQTLDDIKELKTGAGFQWVIRGILEQNQFDVIASRSYESLFKMLNADRFSTFSRGVNEIFTEFETHQDKNPNIQIDQATALYTPLPTFYFVSPKNKALAKRIQQGLEIMLETGEFDTLFYQFHKDILAKATLGSRKVFILNNPNLSEKTRQTINNRELWYIPDDTGNNF